ncbi:MAG: hypothetical protein J6S21_00515, partial [Victivallales bacterium]|nr:hypothetical protein [Victivallales bacterium]
MMRYAFLLILLQTLLVLAAEPHVHLQQRVSTGSAPVIDGRLTAGEWDDAAKLPPFYQVDSMMNRSDLLNEVYLKYDRKALYIGFKTHAGIDLDLKPTPFDSQAITGVECLDVRLIVKGQKQWRRFAVERTGSKLDQLFRGHIMDNPSDWNPAWEYKCHLTPMEFSSWSVWEGEIAIPWAALEIEYPAEARRLSAMFIRYHGNVSLSDTTG